jgi:hypothetical protein
MTTVTYYPGYSQLQVQMNFIWQVIASITQSFPMVVTTVNNHNYVAGVKVKFLIPHLFGMQQLNNLRGQVTNLTSNTLTINIDSTKFDAFSYPSPLPNAYSSPTVFADSSGPYLAPLPLPYGNQDSFEGVIYNDGTSLNPINGL